MGTSKGQSTFMGHLKWIPALALGYVAGIGMHFFVNGQDVRQERVLTRKTSLAEAGLLPGAR